MRKLVGLLSGLLLVATQADTVGTAIAEPDTACWYPWSNSAHGWASMLGQYSVRKFSTTFKQGWTVDPSRATVMSFVEPVLQTLDSKLYNKNEDMLYLLRASEQGTITYRWNPEQIWVDKKGRYDRRTESLQRNYDVTVKKLFWQRYVEQIVRDSKLPVITCRAIDSLRSEAWIPQLTHINWAWARNPALNPPYAAEPTMSDQDSFVIRLVKYQPALVGGSDIYWIDAEWENLDGWLMSTGQWSCNRIYYWMDYWSMADINSADLFGSVGDRDAKFWIFNAHNDTLGYNVWVDKMLQQF